MQLTASSIYFLSFLLAFCSLVYEFIFAQILSVTIGNTKNQYLITISIFTFALGCGAIATHFTKDKIHPKKNLFLVEIFLTILGSLGPFIMLYLSSSGNQGLLFLSYLIIFIIGFLSGFEIPCLINLGTGLKGKILAFDYIGMLAACLLFPLIILPILGIAGGAIFISLLNGIAFFWLTDFKKSSKFILFFILSFFLFLTINHRDTLGEIMIEIYLDQK